MRTLRSTLALFALLTLAVQAQTPEPLRRVVLTNGTVIVGTVEDEAADPIVVVTPAGIEQRIPAASVRAIEAAPTGRFTRQDPNASRLYYLPTARPMGRGTARLGTSLYFVPGIAYGATDWLDLSASGIVAGGGGLAGFLNFNAKAAVVQGPGGSVALGGSALLPFGDDVDGAVLGTLYALGTLGDVTRSVTVGLMGAYGANITTGDAATTFGDGVLVALGGEVQLTNGLKLIGEAYVPVFDGVQGVLALPGVRFFGDHFTVDVYAAIGSVDGDFGGFAPLANFSYTF